MLRIIFTTLLLYIGISVNAQIKLPDLSPRIELNQTIGLTEFKLSYSRPSLRGRKLFGMEGVLVFEEKWRTGANTATKIEISKDIEINGQRLNKGAYVLLTTPHKETWSFHFYPYEKLSYTKFLKKKPLLEFTLASTKTSYSTESFLLHFDALTLNTAKLVLQWENYRVEVPIKIKEHEAIMANIENVLNGPSKFNYFQASLYLHETQSNLELALTYIRKVTQNESPLFFQVYREALILKDLKRKEEAIEAAKRSIELSKKAGNEDFVRLSKRMIDELSE